MCGRHLELLCFRFLVSRSLRFPSPAALGNFSEIASCETLWRGASGSERNQDSIWMVILLIKKYPKPEIMNAMRWVWFYHDADFYTPMDFRVHTRSVQTGVQRKERRRWNESRSVKGEAGESWQCEKACKGIRGLSCSKRRLCDTKKGRQGGNARAGWASVKETEDRRGLIQRLGEFRRQGSPFGEGKARLNC